MRKQAHPLWLSADDKEALDGIADVIGIGDDASAFAWAAVEAVQELATAGDDAAGRIIEAATFSGLRAYGKWRQKDDRGLFRVAKTGQIVALPTRFGSRRKRPDGTAARAWQQGLWWEYPWDQFEQVVNDLRKQVGRLDVEIAALDGVAKLREKHPDTATPLEACEREGIDPRSFGLDDSGLAVSADESVA